MDMRKIKSDLTCLNKGQDYNYYTGHLANINNPDAVECYILQEFTYNLYENNRIDLLQKKISNGVFQYIARGK